MGKMYDREEEYKAGDRVRRFRSGETGVLVSKPNLQGWWIDHDDSGKLQYWDMVNFEKVDEVTVSVKQKALEWLTASGKWSSERGLAFIDLAKQGAFSPNIEDKDFRILVNTYLHLNDRKFCESGIAEARKEIGLELETEEIRFTVILTKPKSEYNTIISAWEVWIQSALQHKKESIGYHDCTFRVKSL